MNKELDKIKEILKLKKKVKVSHNKLTSAYNKKEESGHYTIYSGRPLTKTYKIITKFTFVPMPGCCGVVISTEAYVWNEYRKKGIGIIANNFRIKLAKSLGYGSLICTFVETNSGQKKILEKNGWSLSDPFVNPRTGNTLFYATLNLNERNY